LNGLVDDRWSQNLHAVTRAANATLVLSPSSAEAERVAVREQLRQAMTAADVEFANANSPAGDKLRYTCPQYIEWLVTIRQLWGIGP